MMYALTKILWWIARPETLLLFLCVTGPAILWWRRTRRLGRAMLVVGVAGLAVSAWLPLGTWLLRPLEDRFPPPHRLPAHVDGIIVLGGAIELQESRNRDTPVLNMRAARMTGFVALARRFPSARLIFSGGNPDPFGKGATEAEVARKIFDGLGIGRDRIMYEDRSRNTRENAVYSEELVRPAPRQIWILVTSAADIPRAVGCFRAIGWPVLAFPVDYHTPPAGLEGAPGLARGLEEIDWATHEWIGLLYYRWRGWIPSLFPAP